MFPIRLFPDQVEFVLLSFEGPDPYSLAGGLGVRITNLALSLAAQGFLTHLIFIGSPDLPGREELSGGRLQLHRWCQWISRHHPLGVYDGEEGKLLDWNASLPAYIVEQIARPGVEQGRQIIVLAEEWHTAESLILLSDRLHVAGLRPYCVLLWNANNTKGFDRVHWNRLDYVSTLTTVSRYMKQIMRTYGYDPLVIPNGIPCELLEPVSQAITSHVRQGISANGELILLKVARYDPDKCWMSAMEAAAQLKGSGETIRFLCRGGIEAHGAAVLCRARELGLDVKDIQGNPHTWEEALEAICSAGPADVYNLQFHMPQSILSVFYAAADFVLANSKHEPFGLVGLEAMAAGGVAFTGSSGESYSVERAGAIALDTDQAGELVLAIQNLRLHPEKTQAIRQAAPYVAARYTWENILEILFEKIILAGISQGVQPIPTTKILISQPVWDRGRTPSLPATARPRPVEASPVDRILSAVPG
jgi:glycosyltransferase involved in cell wall biosynthesis